MEVSDCLFAWDAEPEDILAEQLYILETMRNELDRDAMSKQTSIPDCYVTYTKRRVEQSNARNAKTTQRQSDMLTARLLEMGFGKDVCELAINRALEWDSGRQQEDLVSVAVSYATQEIGRRVKHNEKSGPSSPNNDQEDKKIGATALLAEKKIPVKRYFLSPAIKATPVKRYFLAPATPERQTKHAFVTPEHHRTSQTKTPVQEASREPVFHGDEEFEQGLYALMEDLEEKQRATKVHGKLHASYASTFMVPLKPGRKNAPPSLSSSGQSSPDGFALQGDSLLTQPEQLDDETGYENDKEEEEDEDAEEDEDEHEHGDEDEDQDREDEDDGTDEEEAQFEDINGDLVDSDDSGVPRSRKDLVRKLAQKRGVLAFLDIEAAEDSRSGRLTRRTRNSEVKVERPNRRVIIIESSESD